MTPVSAVAAVEMLYRKQDINNYLSLCPSFSPLQVKRDMVAIKHELDTVQQVKEEIEELREYVDRLEEHTHRRKLRLMEQVSENSFRFLLKRIRFYDSFVFVEKTFVFSFCLVTQ